MLRLEKKFCQSKQPKKAALNENLALATTDLNRNIDQKIAVLGCWASVIKNQNSIEQILYPVSRIIRCMQVNYQKTESFCFTLIERLPRLASR